MLKSRAFGICSTLLILTAGILFTSTGRDDAHITFWPAHTLVHYGQILNYNGDAVEQSSSLGFVLVLALSSKLLPFLSMPTLGWLLSILFGILTLWMTLRLAYEIIPERFLLPGILLATSSAMGYWTSSAMEGTMAAFSTAWILLEIALYLKQQKKAPSILLFLSFLLFVLVRPEHPLILMGALISFYILLKIKTHSETHDTNVRKSFILLLIAGFLLIILLATRYHLFGSLFPNPVSGKLGLASLYELRLRFEHGLRYLVVDCFSPVYSFIYFFVLLGSFKLIYKFFKEARPNLTLSLCVIFLFLYTLFIIAVGGDWMPLRRFLLPVEPLLMILFISLWSFIPKKWNSALLFGIILMALFQTTESTAYAIHTGKKDLTMPLWKLLKTPEISEMPERYVWKERSNPIHRRWTPTIEFLDKFITYAKERTDDKIVILGRLMGIIPYHISLKHFKDIEFIDRHGLIESSLANCSIMKKRHRVVEGTHINYPFYLDNMARMEEECNMPKPDIIFDKDNKGISDAGLKYNFRKLFIYKIPHSSDPIDLKVTNENCIYCKRLLVTVSESFLEKIRFDEKEFTSSD